MVMLLPALGSAGVPARVRLVLALAISLALTPTVQSAYPAVAPTSTIALTILIAQEVVAGILVGGMAAMPTGDMAQMVIGLVSGAFALGFQLAAPFLVFGFAVYAALGILAKLMPQLQVFFVAVPINILCGFVIMMALLGSMMTIFLNYYATAMSAFL